MIDPYDIRRILVPILPRSALKRLQEAYLAASDLSTRIWFYLPNRPGFVRRRQYPEILDIALTTRCNLRCFICRPDGYPGEDFPFEHLGKLENAVRHARTINLTGWGEPFLYPRFQEVIDYVLSLNPREHLVSVITNGTRLSASFGRLLKGRIKTLTISLNAAEKETYERDTGCGRFEDTLAGVRAFLAEIGKNERLARIYLHFVAHTRNYSEIPDFVGLAHDLGVGNVSVGHFLVNRPAHEGYGLWHVKHEYNRVIDEANERARQWHINLSAKKFFADKPRAQPTPCLSPFRECFILIDGRVLPCCYSNHYVMGNITQASFEDIWFGPKYRALRRKRHLPACRRCSAHTHFDEDDTHFASSLKK